MSLRLSLASCLLLPSLLWGGTGRLTLEAIGHPTRKEALVGTAGTRLEWLPDGTLLQTRKEKDGLALLQVDPATGEARPLVAADRLRALLEGAGATAEAATAALKAARFTWDGARKRGLLPVGDDLFLVDLKRNSARRLIRGKAEEATFSPDGTQVAYLRGNDLYAMAVATARERRLTRGGTETRFNGRLDWVYQEEVYGRGGFRAFWWAPDSKRLAFLSLDETKVPVFTLMDDRFQPQKAERARYPKAGDPNPIARLGVVDLQGRVAWQPAPHPGEDGLIVQVGWDPKGRLLASHQNRTQTWLELIRYDASGSRRLIREEGKAWQERLPLPTYLPDGGFLWESGRSGRQHVYRYDAQDRLVGAVTSGDWDVRKVQGLDPSGRFVFLDTTERSPLGLDTVRLDLRTGERTCLTPVPGTHRTRFNPAFSLFLDTWSDIHTPPQQCLHDGAGTLIRVIDANPSEGYHALALGEVKFQQVPTRDGIPMEAMLVLPVGFDPAKRYPVFQHIYGGPGAPTVRNAWSRDMLWFQFLAQQGYVTWICDNRSASAKGWASAHGVFRNLGTQELQDQLDGLAWLKAQGWADTSRVCLDGWSYGGYMTAYALTHSGGWKLGVAGAPVTDWKLYDSIYTERYMGLPSENPEGYASSSVLTAAKHLKGKLLILHGTLDDNVHPQNTIMLIDALEKAGQDFELRLYPGSDHVSAFGKPWQAWDILRARWDFISRNL